MSVTDTIKTTSFTSKRRSTRNVLWPTNTVPARCCAMFWCCTLAWEEPETSKVIAVHSHHLRWAACRCNVNPPSVTPRTTRHIVRWWPLSGASSQYRHNITLLTGSRRGVSCRRRTATRLFCLRYLWRISPLPSLCRESLIRPFKG